VAEGFRLTSTASESSCLSFNLFLPPPSRFARLAASDHDAEGTFRTRVLPLAL
jgi:hypothetical protein